jgi:radical SAM protein with 4Fe4S-binding SPASM domain
VLCNEKYLGVMGKKIFFKTPQLGNYKLSPHVALRGWFGEPFTYINYKNGLVYRLSKPEFELIKKFETAARPGKNQFVNSLLKDKVIEPCGKFESVRNWQKYRFCSNNCFTTIYWSITGKCNYNCKHCFMATDNQKLKTEFTFKECVKFLDSCEKCGIFNAVITGGEPFVHPDFLRILHECQKRCIMVKEILTNGSLITEEILDEIRKIGINPLFKVSFDGIGTHDWIRNQNGAEKVAIDAIKLLKRKNFRVCVQLSLHKSNLESLYPTAKLLDKIGIERFRIIRTCESPRWEKFAENQSLSVSEYYDAGLKFAKKYVENKHLMTSEIWKFLTIYPKFKKYKCIPILNNGSHYKSLPICSEMRFCINVLSSGEVVPCNRLAGYFNKFGMKFGNVKTDNLEQLLLDSKYFDFVRKTVQNYFDMNPKCAVCKFKSQCYVGCRAGAMVFNHSLNGPDGSKCIYFENDYPNKTKSVFSKVDEDYSCVV